MSVQEDILELFANVDLPATREQICGEKIARGMLLDKALSYNYIKEEGGKFRPSSGFLRSLIEQVERNIEHEQEHLKHLNTLLTKVECDC